MNFIGGDDWCTPIQQSFCQSFPYQPKGRIGKSSARIFFRRQSFRFPIKNTLFSFIQWFGIKPKIKELNVYSRKFNIWRSSTKQWTLESSKKPESCEERWRDDSVMIRNALLVTKYVPPVATTTPMFPIHNNMRCYFIVVKLAWSGVNNLGKL